MIDLDAVNTALIHTVDGLTADELAAPSLLPDWSRAHVVAHLALNAEGMAGALDGVARGEVVAMYASDGDRNAAIDALAEGPPDELRERLLAGTARLRDAIGALSGDDWEATFPRVPGGPAWPVSSVLPTRVREIEIHHADLGCDYSPADWSREFAEALLEVVTVDQEAAPETPPLAVHASDLDQTWLLGAGGPVVTGTAAALGWWLSGRGSGEGLSCDAGALPVLGPWRRAVR
jgi:maleylpyruvate isomerase